MTRPLLLKRGLFKKQSNLFKTKKNRLSIEKQPAQELDYLIFFYLMTKNEMFLPLKVENLFY